MPPSLPAIRLSSSSHPEIINGENDQKSDNMNSKNTSPKKSIGVIFLKDGIERILKDVKEEESGWIIKRSDHDHAQLKKACECTLEELNSGDGHLSEASSSFEADRHFFTLELACQSKSPKVVASSLACIQKLIAHGHLTGNGVDTSNPERRLIDRIAQSICSTTIVHESNEKVTVNSSQAILEMVVSNKCKIHGESLILAVRTCFNIFLSSPPLKNGIKSAAARSAEFTLKMGVNSLFERSKHSKTQEKDDGTVVKEVMEMLVTAAEEAIESTDRAGIHRTSVSKSEETDEVFPNIYQEDVFLIFQELCILSQIEENETTNDQQLRFKLMILGILEEIFRNHFTVIQSSPPCITVLKRILCIALTQNATLNPNTQVFEKSCDLFVELLDKFKAHLKPSIEVFFKDIILPILVLDAYSFDQKRIVMKTIEKILTNPQSVVDMYVNYDLGLTSGNLFKLIVEEISKTTVLTGNDYTPHAQKIREKDMRLLGLGCLSNILQCLVDWWQVCEMQKMTSDIEEDLNNHQQNEKSELEKFEAVKQQKNLLEQGIQIFTNKPKKGLKFLQDNGFVGVTANEVAEFMMREERLDKTQVGDYLGDPDQFNCDVMNAYIDSLDFSSIGILAALRLFLEKFRLPGEAQKIDRLMLKFASRYLDCNPNQDTFANADAAYVLAFSIILLTTDLHNKTIKNKITKEGYISMNRGINDGGNIPEELLLSIFDDISKNEIKMKAGATALLRSRVTPGQGALATDEERRKMAAVEMQAMSQTARALMESASDTDSHFTPAQHQHHVRPMFEMCWAPCLVAFSMGVQLSDDEEEWTICLRGLRLGVRAACFLQDRTEKETGEKLSDEKNKKKEAFVKALTGFTLLTHKSALGEMKKKNVEAINTLLLIGHEDGEYLEESWIDVMRCISYLELVQMIGTGVNSNLSHEEDSSLQYVMKATGDTMDEETLEVLRESLGESFSQGVGVAIDRIFDGSSRLSAEAIVHFVNALCEVSREELSHPDSPRMFLLGKVVDVAFYNMNRIRFEWGRIWTVIGEHFNAAGCNPNESVAFFSIDALRQLSIKFLEKGELPNFRFQKEFLRPFEVIMLRSDNHQVRNLVVQCCTYLVKAHSSCLRSGWQNIFSVLTISSGDASMEIVKNAFQTTAYVIEHRFKNDFAAILGSFQDVLKCLDEYACNPNLPGKNTEAIRLIGLCAVFVAENSHRIDEDVHRDSHLFKGLSSDQQSWLRAWLPIFLKLSSIINESRSDVRKHSLKVMFEVMDQHGANFKAEWWKDLFDIIFKIFDPTKIEIHDKDKQEWISTTCNHAMPRVMDTFTKHFTQLSTELLPRIYKQFLDFIQQKNQQLALCAISCFEWLVSRNGERFTEIMWGWTIALIENLFAICPSSESEYSFFSAIRYELVDSISRFVLGGNKSVLGENINNVGLFTHIQPESLLRVCDVLAKSYEFAKDLKKNGQNVIKLETRSLGTMLSIVIRLLYDQRAETITEEVSKRVLDVVALSFEGYGAAGTDRNAYEDVVCELLSECNKLPIEMLSNLGSDFPSKLCDLVKTVDGQRMRDLLSDLLRRFTCR